eukprot:3079819-Pleurochrysis_carterae.AAC.1
MQLCAVCGAWLTFAERQPTMQQETTMRACLTIWRTAGCEGWAWRDTKKDEADITYSLGESSCSGGSISKVIGWFIICAR